MLALRKTPKMRGDELLATTSWKTDSPVPWDKTSQQTHGCLLLLGTEVKNQFSFCIPP